jgi:hypothetical protein
MDGQLRLTDTVLTDLSPLYTGRGSVNVKASERAPFHLDVQRFVQGIPTQLLCLAKLMQRYFSTQFLVHGIDTLARFWRTLRHQIGEFLSHCHCPLYLKISRYPPYRCSALRIFSSQQQQRQSWLLFHTNQGNFPWFEAYDNRSKQ